MKILIPSSFRASPLLLVAFAGLVGLVTSLMAGFAPFEFARAPLPDNSAFQLEAVEDEELDGGGPMPEIIFAIPSPSAEVPAAGSSPSVDAAAVLRAIAEVESRGNPACVGRLGERGLYQFRRDTWRQHTRENFARAHHPAISTTVAHRHYDWIARELRKRGFEGSPYEIALAWNAGLQRVLAGRASASAHHYAQRVANLAAP